MSRAYILVAMLLSSISLSNGVFAQTARSSSENPTERRAPVIADELIEIAAAATIYRDGAGTIRAEFPLGVLEAGKKYRLKLGVINPREDLIEFDRAQVGCTCMGFEAEAKQIPANGTAVFVVTFLTRSSANGRTNVEYIKLMNTGVEMPIGILQLNYELSNFFAVKSDRIVIEIPQE